MFYVVVIREIISVKRIPLMIHIPQGNMQAYSNTSIICDSQKYSTCTIPRYILCSLKLGLHYLEVCRFKVNEVGEECSIHLSLCLRCRIIISCIDRCS